MFSKPPSLQRLNQEADRLRDDRRWAEAAQVYEAFLKRAPKRSDIWVQYGHCLKEAGSVPAAKQAYEKALSIDGTQADTWLQLGHANKMLGLREEAIRAYATALQHQPTLVAAIVEVSQLAGSAMLPQERGSGVMILEDTLFELKQVRKVLRRLESALPPLSALNSFAIDRFSLFRRYFRTPPPPLSTQRSSCHVVILANAAADPVGIGKSIESLHAQEHQPAAITVLAGAPAAEQAKFEGIDVVSCNDSAMALALQSIVGSSSSDVLVTLRAGSTCTSRALAWLCYAFEQTASDVAVVDEILETAAEDQSGESVPLLRQCPTEENWANSVSSGALVGFRLGSLRDPVLARTFLEAASYAGWMNSLRGKLIACHVPQFLVSTRSPPRGRNQGPTVPLDRKPSSLARTKAPQQRIGLVIPTRNLVEFLEVCLTSARSMATRPELLDIVILDNGSDDERALKYLSQEVQRGTIVVRNDDAFNWSALNNIGAQQVESPLLVFSNNDIEFHCRGWDDFVRNALQTTATGAVGARLLYPDGSVQHAGIVFRPDGLPEHEGRNSAGDIAGPEGRWLMPRQVGAVTGAFLAVRRSDFLGVGGFDEVNLPIWFSDLDLCLKLRAHSDILYEPAIELVHHESKTIRREFEDDARVSEWQRSAEYMRRKWGPYLHFDPGYNPHYASWGAPFAHIVLPNQEVTTRHICLSARPNPWRTRPLGRTGKAARATYAADNST